VLFRLLLQPFFYVREVVTICAPKSDSLNLDRSICGLSLNGIYYF
jgi:hypothetical protein